MEGSSHIIKVLPQPKTEEEYETTQLGNQSVNRDWTS